MEAPALFKLSLFLALEAMHIGNPGLAGIDSGNGSEDHLEEHREASANPEPLFRFLGRGDCQSKTHHAERSAKLEAHVERMHAPGVEADEPRTPAAARGENRAIDSADYGNGISWPRLSFFGLLFLAFSWIRRINHVHRRVGG